MASGTTVSIRDRSRKCKANSLTRPKPIADFPATDGPVSASTAEGRRFVVVTLQVDASSMRPEAVGSPTLTAGFPSVAGRRALLTKTQRGRGARRQANGCAANMAPFLLLVAPAGRSPQDVPG
jgi:hypothetical protein